MAANTSDSFRPALMLDPTMTTVLVGPERQRFGVHKSLLCHFSSPFRAAYESQTTEAQNHEFVFIDVDPEVFSILVTWFYTASIFLKPMTDDHLGYEALEKDDAYDPDEDEPSESGLSMSSSTMGDDEEGAAARAIEWEIELGIHTDDEDEDEEEDSEECRRLRAVHPRGTKLTQAAELDVYRLKAIIKMAEMDGEGLEYVPKWKEVLLQKEAALTEEDKSKSEVDSETHSPASAGDSLFGVLAHLYILAHRFDIRALRDLTMDTLQGRLEMNVFRLPTFQTVITAFEKLPSDSKLLVWLIHIYAHLWNPNCDTAEQAVLRHSLPKEFMLGVMMEHATAFPTMAFRRDLCLYHDHATDEDVKQCREARGVTVTEKGEVDDSLEDQLEDEDEDEDDDEDEDEEDVDMEMGET